MSVTDDAVVYKHPLYLREHAKRVLRTALFNDSASLCVRLASLLISVRSSLPVKPECHGLFTRRWSGLEEARAGSRHCRLYPDIYVGQEA